MFGNLEFHFGERRLDDFASRKAERLFAFLLLSPGRRYERGYLAAQFWGDLPESRARKALKTEVWRICEALKKQGLDPDHFLLRRQGSIAARRRAAYWTDVGAFELALKRLDSTEPESCSSHVLGAITGALELYLDDLLEGVFDDWCLVRRETLIAGRSKALDFLMRYYLHNQRWQTAAAHGQRLLQLDPLMEHVHRALMCCHFRMGNRPAAIMQYEKCRRILSAELGVRPMAETEGLCQAMLASRPYPELAPNRPASGDNMPLDRMVDVAIASLSATS